MTKTLAPAQRPFCHGEEQSDEAISTLRTGDCFDRNDVL